MRCFQTAYPLALSAGGVRMFVQDSPGNHFCFHKFEYVHFLHFCRRSQLTPSMQLRAGIPLVAALLRCSTAVTLSFFGSWRPEFLFFTLLLQSLLSRIIIIIFEACLYVHRNRFSWKSCVLRYPWMFFLNKLLMCGFEGTRKCNGSNFRYWLIRARMKMTLAR